MTLRLRSVQTLCGNGPASPKATPRQAASAGRVWVLNATTEVNFYFLFSVQSQIAKAAVTMKAGMLGHIGNTTVLAVIFT